ncbi:CBS domain-containing protein [candidate division GN15 bacterium]|nr:CBS domain-containing protein [candidate division GN15 bacterium]
MKCRRDRGSMKQLFRGCLIDWPPKRTPHKEGHRVNKSMSDIRAEDVMIPLDQYPHIPYWFTLRQAMVEMERSELEINGRKSLPRMVLIFDEKYRLMGMARRRDILRGLEPEFLRDKPLQYRKKLWEVETDPDLSELSYDKVLEDCRRLAEQPISEVMIPIQATVRHNDHIVRVTYEMNKHNLSLLPVMKDNAVVGVVRSVDIFHEFAKIILDETPLK